MLDQLALSMRVIEQLEINVQSLTFHLEKSIFVDRLAQVVVTLQSFAIFCF
jgi:hypothetical protein